MTPAFDLGATPATIKRIQKGVPKAVQGAWEELKAQLRRHPRFVVPDKRTGWRKAFRKTPNHRHADVPGAWRCSWTICNVDGGERVTVIFLGTHKEYDRLYGFHTSWPPVCGDREYRASR